MTVHSMTTAFHTLTTACYLVSTLPKVRLLLACLGTYTSKFIQLSGALWAQQCVEIYVSFWVFCVLLGPIIASLLRNSLTDVTDVVGN